jgi:beta-lactamase regulating signal transducer with metallopeptidase domain
MNTFLAMALSNVIAAGALAVLVFGVSLWVRRPALIHGLWLIVLLKLITPPVLTITLERPVRVDPPRAAGRVEAIRAPAATTPAAGDAVPASPPSEGEGLRVSLPPGTEKAGLSPAAMSFRPIPWTTLALVVWFMGSASWLALLVLRLGRFRKLLRNARAAPEWLKAETRTLGSKLGLSRVPELRVLPGAVSPMIFAFGSQPLILLPQDLLPSVSQEGMRSLLAHELAHLRRRDHWVRVVELLATCLYWWLPLVWWVRRRLRNAEEECCDAWVVWALPETEASYAEALVQVVSFLSRSPAILPPVASGVGHFSDLKRRISMVMTGGTPHRLSPRALGVVLGLGLLVPLIPAWAAKDAALPLLETTRRGEREKPDEVADQTYRYEKAEEQLKLDQAALREAELLSLSPAILGEAHSAIEKDKARVEAAHQKLVELAHDFPEILKKNGSRPSCATCHAPAPGRPGVKAPTVSPAPKFKVVEKVDLPNVTRVTVKMAAPNDGLSATDEKTGYKVSVADEGRTLECIRKDGKTVWRTQLGSKATLVRQLSIVEGNVRVQESTRARSFDLLSGREEGTKDPAVCPQDPPPLRGKVTGVNLETGTVMISIGTDQGVVQGQEFTVYRDGNFVAKIVIDRADLAESAGKIVLRKEVPRVGDEASWPIPVVLGVSRPNMNQPVLTQERDARRPAAGKVALVDNSRGLVSVDLRERDGARAGMRLEVRRQGQRIGTILITDVQPWGSWAKPEGDLGFDQIQKGDQVTEDTTLREMTPKPTPSTAPPAATVPHAPGAEVPFSQYGQKFEGQDLVDVLKARVEVQAAKLREAETAAQHAARRLDYIRPLVRNGVAAQSELLDRQSEAEICQSHVEVKRAELKEVEVMLRQAEGALRKSEPTKPR